jgi:hypothetical protein
VCSTYRDHVHAPQRWGARQECHGRAVLAKKPAVARGGAVRCTCFRVSTICWGAFAFNRGRHSPWPWGRRFSRATAAMP